MLKTTLFHQNGTDFVQEVYSTMYQHTHSATKTGSNSGSVTLEDMMLIIHSISLAESTTRAHSHKVDLGLATPFRNWIADFRVWVLGFTVFRARF